MLRLRWVFFLVLLVVCILMLGISIRAGLSLGTKVGRMADPCQRAIRQGVYNPECVKI